MLVLNFWVLSLVVVLLGIVATSVLTISVFGMLYIIKKFIPEWEKIMGILTLLWYVVMTCVILYCVYYSYTSFDGTLYIQYGNNMITDSSDDFFINLADPDKMIDIVIEAHNLNKFD